MSLYLLFAGGLGRSLAGRGGKSSLVRLVAGVGVGVALGARLLVGALLAAGDGVVAHLREVDAGVEDGEEGAAEEDEGAIEDEEAWLVLHDVVAPATSHFGNTVDAADKDAHVGRANGGEKNDKVAAAPDAQAVGLSGLGRAHPASHAQEIVEAEGAKDGQHGDLQRDAGNDGLVARLLQLGVVVAGGGGDAAADGLHDEARDVGGQEEARVPDGGQARETRVEGEGNVLEREVDADADEGRAEDDGADLQLKRAIVPRIRGEQDATDVAGGF